MKGPVFLSASVPDRPGYKSDPIAVREAVHALVPLVVVDGPLVFGGHPAISPYVWKAANTLNAANQVYIYQSEKYRQLVPKEATYFNNLVWTPGVAKTPADPADPFDKDKSLELMRDTMVHRRALPDRNLTLDRFRAAIFIGGMDGVEEEWRLFRLHYPNTPAYPVASTEGAAAKLLDQPNIGGPLQRWEPMLREEQCYRTLFEKLLP